MDPIEVFRAGSYPQGSFSAAEVQALADHYDPNWCDAPVTIDHQQTGPRYGRVASLSVENGVLKAQLEQVPDSFAEQIREGRYTARSVEIFRDLEGKRPYLKAVSFLGAQTPQVKGLAPIQFKDAQAESVHIEFAQAPESTPPAPPADPPAPKPSESYEELAARLAFSEQRRREAEQALDRNRLQARRLEFESFLHEQIAYGNLDESQQASVMALLEALAGAPAFSQQIEGHSDPVALFKALLRGKTEQDPGLFHHVATPPDPEPPAPGGRSRLEQLIRADMAGR